MQTVVEQAHGQMFRRRIHPQLFTFGREKRIYLHTFFVKAPLHIYFLDRNLTIVSEQVTHPFRTCSGYGAYVLEVAPGTFKAKIGDQLSLGQTFKR